MSRKKAPSRERRTLRYPPSFPKKPKDWLRFIQSDEFEECWQDLELDDDDLRALEMIVMINPDGHPVIEGTGGVRKLRFSSDTWAKGKSGGARVYYLYIPNKGIVYLLFVHMKDDLETITDEQKKGLKLLVKSILSCFE